MTYTWQTIYQDVLSHRRRLVLAQCIAVVAVLLSVPIPLLMPLLVDEVLLQQPGVLVKTANALFPQAWHGAVLYICATLAATLLLRLGMLVLTVWQLHYFAFIAKDVTYKLRKTLIAHLQRVSMSEFETLGSGKLGAHLVTDIEAIDKFLGEAVSKALIAVLSLVGISIVLLWLHWQLALILLLMNPAVIYFTVVLGKRVKQLKLRENKAIELFQQCLSDTLDAIHQIRASNRETHYLAQVIDRARRVKRDGAVFSWKSDAANRFSFGVFLFGFDVFRAITMMMVVFSDLSIGEMMAVFGYLWFMMSPVQEVLNIQYTYYSAKAALGRINGLFTLREEPVFPHEVNPFRGHDTVSISVKDLVFRYRSDDTGEEREPVLNGVTLDIAAGEKVALVGASGGGKSTLVQVILGMYPLQSGQLKFNNVPVERIGMDVVRENVATVLQHPALFNDTVRQNLTLGREIDDDELYQALAIAQLDDTMRSLPQGLDSVIGRQGIRLSGGQRQRLAIARMVLSRPKVVILDEATSALDTETEERVHRGLHEFLKGRTTLIIAHRLSAVKQADRVLVFDDGQIIEEGIHEELIRGDGLYSRLYGRHQS